MKTKLLIFFCSALFVSTTMKAQLVVEDPTMVAVSIKNWGEQLAEAQKQFSAIKEQSAFLQEGIDQYKKVNTVIKQAKQVKNLIDMQVKLLSEIGNANASGKNSKNLKLFTGYNKRLEYIADQSKENVEQLTDILLDSKLNLTDFERLQMIDKLNERSNMLLGAVRSERKKFESLDADLNALEELKQFK